MAFGGAFNPGWGMRIRIMLTSILVFGLVAAVIGAMMGAMGMAGSGSVFFWLLVSLLMVGVQWWLGPVIIKWATGAKELNREGAPELFGIVEGLAKKAGLPMPKLYLVNNPSPNAFAFGRTQSDSGIAVHSGLLHALSREELEGVLAHELGHINNRDVAVMTVASVLPVLLYYGVLIFAPRNRNDGIGLGEILGAFAAQFVGQLLVMWLSRQREYFADEFSARLTNHPAALMGALAKITYGQTAGAKTGADSRSMVKALYFAEHSGAKLGAAEAAHMIAEIGSGDPAAIERAIEKEKKMGGFEFLMTHPLTAKRLENLMRIGGKIAA